MVGCWDSGLFLIRLIQFVLGIGMHLGLDLCFKRFCLIGGLHCVILKFNI